MPPDDGSKSSSTSSSTFADVLKTLTPGRRRSQSPSPSGQKTSSPPPPPIISRPDSLAMEGRRGSRVTFGFESLHRGSLGANNNSNSSASASSDTTPLALDFETSIRNLSHQHALSTAIDQAEKVCRSLHFFSSDQATSIWEAGAYLLDESQSPEARNAGSQLLEAVTKRQDLSPTLRQAVFRSISQASEVDTLPARVNALLELTEHGRSSDFTEEPILPIAASWILPLYELAATSRSKHRKSGNSRSEGASREEVALGNLFHFVGDLIKLQPHPPAEKDVELLLEQVVGVCKQTVVTGDIKSSLAVFDAIISTSVIPASAFDSLVQILCNIHASVKTLAGTTTGVVLSLAKSQKQSELISTLHAFLSGTSEKGEQNTHVVRGAIIIFSDLVRSYGQAGMPSISFTSLVESLQSSAKRNDGRIDAEILEACVNILKGEFVNVALQNSWDDFMQVIRTSSRRVTDSYTETGSSAASPVTQPVGGGAHRDDVRPNISANISRIASKIETLWSQLDKQRRLEAALLFMDVHRELNVNQTKLALEWCKGEQLCYPTHPNWFSRCHKILNDFILARDKPPEIRVSALSTFEDAYFHNSSPELFNRRMFVYSVLDNFSDESSPLFFGALVAFLVELAMTCADDIFQMIIQSLGSSMVADENLNASTPTAVSAQPIPTLATAAAAAAPATDTLVASLSNISTEALVKIFLRFHHKCRAKAALVFEALIDIAKAADRPSDARLSALRLLFRIRCDSSGSVYVVQTIQNDYLVGILSRTISATSRSSVSEEGSAERPVRTMDDVSLATRRMSLRDPSSGPITSSIQSGSSQRSAKWMAPVWTAHDPIYRPDDSLPSASSEGGGAVAFWNYSPLDATREESKPVCKIALWLESIITIFQREKDWDVYSYVLAHLSAQLANRDLFRNAIPQIKLLRSVLCEQIKNESFHEPLGWTGVKKGDVAVCILDALTMLISFHPYFAKSEQDEIVRTFMLGIGSWEGTPRGCIHALSVCCHEIPLSVTKSLNAILDKMSKVITRTHIAVHILEFLALLARLPSVYVNLRDEEIRPVFGICLRFIQTSREQRYRSLEQYGSRSNSAHSSRLSGGVRELASASQSPDPQTPSSTDNMSRYVYYLTYNVMVFWFLSLKLQDRANHVSWITKRLIFTDESGKDVIEEKSQVFVDFMQRVAYSDLGDTIPFDKFPPSESDGPVSKKSWIIGMSIVTIETAGTSGLSQITKRQASGTTYAVYQQRTAPVFAHQIPLSHDGYSVSDEPYSRSSILPSHVLLQLTTSALPTPTSMQPLPLPDDEFTRRAISTFDRNDIVDGHKIGVVYVSEGQTDETSILANTVGSSDYEHFLSNLGSKVPLKDAKFNTQGLHWEADGESTYAWRDRVTEIIYHVTTMMPTDLETDPRCINKKRHVGNDFVNIIFNDSNMPFNFDTIRSQFNYVNIVISPASRISSKAGQGSEVAAPDHDQDVDRFNQSFFVVQVMSRPDFSHVSASAIPKVISGKNLAVFVRLLAFNASVFSLVVSRGDEYVSSWQNRLREIGRLRDRAFAASARGTDVGADISYPPSARRAARHDDASLTSTTATRSGLVGGDRGGSSETEHNKVFQSLEFSRWS